MNDLQVYLTIGVLSILLIIVVIAWIFTRTNHLNITRTPEAEGYSSKRFSRDRGDEPALPYAEQIEKIVRAELAARPGLDSYAVDFDIAPGGGLQITVDGRTYLEIRSIPEEPIRAIIDHAIASYKENNH
jgi:hypothetical protein